MPAIATLEELKAVEAALKSLTVKNEMVLDLIKKE